MVSVIAMGNTVQSFRDHSFLSEKLYTGSPEFGEETLFFTVKAKQRVTTDLFDANDYAIGDKALLRKIHNST